MPTYDLDGDGLPEFAVIRGEVMAVPADPPDDDSSSWLPFAGTVLAAVIGGVAIVGVAFVNRQGGEQLGLLEERVARLEAARPEEDDAGAP